MVAIPNRFNLREKQCLSFSTREMNLRVQEVMGIKILLDLHLRH